MKRLLLTILFFLAGCSFYQSDLQQFSAMPEQYQGTSTTDQLRSTEQWWLSFNDPALNRLMDRLFAENLDLDMILARLEQVEAQQRSQQASLWPQVDGAASAGRVRSQAIEADSFSLSIGASYELDLWHKLKSRRQAASLTSQAQQHEVEALLLSLSAQLAESYYLVVELRQLVTLNEEIISSFADTVHLVRLRYQRGLVSSLDLYQAQQNLLAAQAELPKLLIQLEQAENSLAILVGAMPGSTDFAPLAQLPQLDHSFATGLPAALIHNRPDVAAAFSRLQAADQQVAAAIADRFPAIKLTANYGGQDNELSKILDSPNIFWNLLVNISQPIIDGGKRQSEVERRQAIFRELAAAYHKAVLIAFAEVENALASEKGNDQALVILAKRQKVSAAALRLALERYQQGLTDFLPVLTAQSTKANADIALIRMQRQRITSRIQLARALGGSWMASQLQAIKETKHDNAP